MWPGFGDNMRVLEWIVRRCKGEVGAVQTPIGRLPDLADIKLDGIRVESATMQALLAVDVEAWKAELAAVGEYIGSYGDRMPVALKTEWERITAALSAA
jgi:phosphoenolpyruvate carboxykinase (GTP)